MARSRLGRRTGTTATAGTVKTNGTNGEGQGSDPQDPAGPREGDVQLALRDVSYVYKTGTEALRSLDLTVNVGRTIAVAGPSGCGKSTLLAILAGLMQPTSGRVARQLDPRGSRHEVAMVFQKDTLLPWLTVEAQVGFHAKLHRRSRSAETKEWVASLLELGGLTEFAGAFPYELSGGMRRRLAFLVAVAPLPRVLLLDEPFSSLDEPTRLAIHQDVFDITRRYGITTVLVTHDLAEAASLSDEVVILTRRPATVASHHEVPFGDQRDLLALRQQRDFLDLYATLWRELSVQLEVRPRAATPERGADDAAI